MMDWRLVSFFGDMGIGKSSSASNFSTFLFTVLVDGAKPSTNFPREAGREAALALLTPF